MNKNTLDIAKIENILKDILTPYVWLLLKNINEKMKNEPFVLIVAGGDALHNFFPQDENLKSHDFDIKLAPILGTENNNNIILQHKISVNIMHYFETELNKYYNNFINPIFYKILKSEGFYEVKISNFKSFQRIGNNCDKKHIVNQDFNINCGELYTLEYAISDNRGKNHQNSLLDLFLVNSKNSNKKHINEYNTNIPKTYIPYIEIEGVNYASLGFLIDDTLEMIKRNTPKRKRYEMKYEHIIKNLYNPTQHFSCYSMKDFIDSCTKDDKQFCSIYDKKFNKEELLDYAVKKKYIKYEMLGFFKNYSLEYLCRYITEIYNTMFLIKPMKIE